MPCKNSPTKPGLYIWYHQGLYQPVYVYISINMSTPYIEYNGILCYLDYLGGEITGGPFESIVELNKVLVLPKKKKLTGRFLDWLVSKLP